MDKDTGTSNGRERKDRSAIRAEKEGLGFGANEAREAAKGSHKLPEASGA